MCIYTLKEQKLKKLKNSSGGVRDWFVFAVSSTTETPNFGTFGGVAHPP